MRTLSIFPEVTFRIEITNKNNTFHEAKLFTIADNKKVALIMLLRF